MVRPSEGGVHCIHQLEALGQSTRVQSIARRRASAGHWSATTFQVVGPEQITVLSCSRVLAGLPDWLEGSPLSLGCLKAEHREGRLKLAGSITVRLANHRLEAGGRQRRRLKQAKLGAGQFGTR